MNIDMSAYMYAYVNWNFVLSNELIEAELPFRLARVYLV